MRDYNNAALKVCIDQARESNISGRLFSQRLYESVCFSSISDLLLKVGEILDRQRFPRAFQRLRSFSTSECRNIPVADTVTGGMPAGQVSEAVGAVSTFQFYVISRRYATWQGQIDWLDGTSLIPFFSVLELIQQIDHSIFQNASTVWEESHE